MYRRANLGKLLACSLVGWMLWQAPAVNAGVIVVTPTSMGNWAFDNRDVNVIVGANPNSSGSIVTGPGSPPLGVGSANLQTGNGTAGGGGDGTEELRNTGYSGVRLDALTVLSYSTYDTLNNGQQFPYLGLMINWTGGTTVDDILFFEPPYQQPSTGDALLPDQGATVMNTWQTWNALGGSWWADSGFGGTGGTSALSLLDYLAIHPDASIVNAGGLGGVRLNVGFASDTDQFNGYVDNVTIGVGQVITTYDFDPASTTTVPEPATLALVGLGLAGLGFSRRKLAN